MFEKWGFLLSEIWVLLALAALLGLFVGWLIWGRREVVIDTSEADRLRADLAACNSKGTDLSKRLTAAEARAAEFEARAAHAAERAAAERFVAAAPKASMAMPVMAKPAAMAKPVAKAKPAANEAPAAAEPAAGTKAKPKGLSAAREGKADDLKLVKGIGPKLEILCNKLGFYHFDQIANWTASEIAWVDDNLEGFKGRVTRDEWVVQARDLAAGKPPRAGGEN
ncbi:MAG: NADH-quinone oxidoreductase subunit E [Microgenomates group bacterium]